MKTRTSQPASTPQATMPTRISAAPAKRARCAAKPAVVASISKRCAEPRRITVAAPRWMPIASRSSGSTSEPMPSSASTSASARRIVRPASSSLASGKPTTSRTVSRSRSPRSSSASCLNAMSRATRRNSSTTLVAPAAPSRRSSAATPRITPSST